MHELVRAVGQLCLPHSRTEQDNKRQHLHSLALIRVVVHYLFARHCRCVDFPITKCWPRQSLALLFGIPFCPYSMAWKRVNLAAFSSIFFLYNCLP